VKAAVMINILGNRNQAAKPKGLEKVKKIHGAYVHVDDKLKVRKQRKMGHITVVGTNLESVYDKAVLARGLITI
jgi:5-(carboxyamino)imidazole ribonucleotide synthase